MHKIENASSEGDSEQITSFNRFQIGQRIHFVGDPRRIGTVRYLGTVEGYSGTWIGVDWDNGDGKHNGTVNGIRYFCTREDKSGSFVRSHNLSPGISLPEALNLRYSQQLTEGEEDEMYVLSASNHRVTVELVGKDKIQDKLSRFEELCTASLTYLGVSSPGLPHTISSLVPNLKELDLTGNLLSKWEDVAAICEELQALEFLNLSNNYMMHDIHLMTSLKNIRVLILNNCSLTWLQVEMLKPSLTAVDELHLMSNKLDAITPFYPLPGAAHVHGFDTLRLLNLEDNHIDSWNEIVKLSHLKRLEQLHLNRNLVKQIYYPSSLKCELVSCCASVEKLNRPFENLSCLLLGGNRIEDMDSVNSLNHFPKLVDIRLSENPVADLGNGGFPRFALIAQLSKVQVLNGSEVTAHERKESEIRYVRLVTTRMHFDDPRDKNQLPPSLLVRYANLKKQHGLEDERPTGVFKPPTMASELITIIFKYIGPSLGEKPTVTKKLPPLTTVGRLKILCGSFFQLREVKPVLLFQEEGSSIPLLLDEEMTSIAELGIISGCTILVNEEGVS